MKSQDVIEHVRSAYTDKLEELSRLLHTNFLDSKVQEKLKDGTPRSAYRKGIEMYSYEKVEFNQTASGVMSGVSFLTMNKADAVATLFDASGDNINGVLQSYNDTQRLPIAKIVYIGAGKEYPSGFWESTGFNEHGFELGIHSYYSLLGNFRKAAVTIDSTEDIKAMYARAQQSLFSRLRDWARPEDIPLVDKEKVNREAWEQIVFDNEELLERIHAQYPLLHRFLHSIRPKNVIGAIDKQFYVGIRKDRQRFKLMSQQLIQGRHRNYRPKRLDKDSLDISMTQRDNNLSIECSLFDEIGFSKSIPLNVDVPLELRKMLDKITI